MFLGIRSVSKWSCCITTRSEFSHGAYRQVGRHESAKRRRHLQACSAAAWVRTPSTNKTTSSKLGGLLDRCQKRLLGRSIGQSWHQQTPKQLPANFEVNRPPARPTRPARNSVPAIR